MIAINPDAHSTGGLDDLEYGISVARRAWLTRDDVANTGPLVAVIERLARSRSRF